MRNFLLLIGKILHIFFKTIRIRCNGKKRRQIRISIKRFEGIAEPGQGLSQIGFLIWFQSCVLSLKRPLDHQQMNKRDTAYGMWCIKTYTEIVRP